MLVKRVLVTDFDHFNDRGVHFNEESDPIGANLFGMPFKQWKELRGKLWPTFSSRKLKEMFPLIQDKTQLLKDYLTNWTETESEVHLKPILNYYNVNVIASVFFGLDLNIFEDPQHEFFRIGSLFLDASKFRNKVVNLAYFFCPELLTLLNIPFLPPKARTRSAEPDKRGYHDKNRESIAGDPQ